MTRPKLAKLDPSAPYTVESLVKLIGLNRRTIERRLQGVPFRMEGRSRIYKLGDACRAIVHNVPDSSRWY